jgi:hypothetical protein
MWTCGVSKESLPAHYVASHNQLRFTAPHPPLLHPVTVPLEVTLQVGAQAVKCPAMSKQ